MEFYRDATWVLEYIEQQDSKGRISGSLQSLVLKSCQKYKLKTNPKHIYAVLDSCWKYKPFLEKVMSKSGILKDIPKKKGKPVYTRLTLLLLIHDLLLSKQKRIQMGKHPIKLFVLRYKSRLHSELVKLKLKAKVRDLSELVDTGDSSNDITPVRWFRINPLRCPDASAVMKELEKKFPQRVESWEGIVPGSIYHDEFIPYLFGIHPQDKITSHELYKQGRIIIQDRASCFPAHILNPTLEDKIIDACSAPGNKTTHVASYMFGNGLVDDVRIFAFEKDPERAKVLQKMIKVAGCSKQISVNVGDFTKLATPSKFPDVTGFIVDPSCSGSGIFGRKYIDSLNRQKKTQDIVDNGVPDEQEEMAEKENGNLQERLSKLSSFQFQVVKHAMSFPKAKRIVYSTCSIHAEENERVALDLLLDEKVKQWGWKIAKRESVIPQWPRRGFVSEFQEIFRDKTASECQEMADGCIRALPREDGGIGFFAICFERDI
ncbi:hypothetical protein KAFR_0H03310 [Kazachstania africana CBS 2517]|uniref:SAM-dependent MTase RsmB/NOP-type domain-containing protein n=1 Tax=Kazachstania africana (strain ATCC 22294 / BCRC 22015 / CBS 2517 / CECT 1963 / NBRC 1671 / NRRL Y-8276) TaxID=1071382 RepID=H2AZI5_KAZAF|nr:hypothetical protein KAFR_0H03310 [Kazachstania africana CBS 2517]CCF59741.1 hypothetical protein KAFR_0H03310 [Kazachstania africana CBS 2517]